MSLRLQVLLLHQRLETYQIHQLEEKTESSLSEKKI